MRASRTSARNRCHTERERNAHAHSNESSVVDRNGRALARAHDVDEWLYDAAADDTAADRAAQLMPRHLTAFWVEIEC